MEVSIPDQPFPSVIRACEEMVSLRMKRLRQQLWRVYITYACMYHFYDDYRGQEKNIQTIPHHSTRKNHQKPASSI